jgi:hypothetical protein
MFQFYSALISIKRENGNCGSWSGLEFCGEEPTLLNFLLAAIASALYTQPAAGTQIYYYEGEIKLRKVEDGSAFVARGLALAGVGIMQFQGLGGSCHA